MTTIKAYYRHEHNDNPVRIHTPEDVDRLIDALLAEPYDNSVASLYVDGRLNNAGVPDHELLLAVNSEDNVGGLRYMSEDGTYFAEGQRSRYEHVVYYYAGSEREFPRDSEVAIDQLRTAVKELLTSGERPESIKWRKQSEAGRQG